jgi:nucleoside-diphosphate-sugar epimerase
MKVLVTGGAGFIGSHLSEALLAAGHQVVALDNLATGQRENLQPALHNPNFRFVMGDARNRDLIRSEVEQVDTVFHLAAHVGVRRIVGDSLDCLLNNVQSTMNVLAAAAGQGVRTIFFSSSEVYGKGAGALLDEDSDLAIGAPSILRWSYAAGKAVDESLAMAYHADKKLPVSVIRCFNTCGPRQTDRYGMVIPTFIGQALAGAPLTVHGDGSQTRCFSYVDDVVGGVLQLAECNDAIGEIFNVGNNEEVSIHQLAELVIELTGSSSQIVHVPYAHAFTESFEDIQQRVPNLTKIRSFVPYEPRFTLREILSLTISSIRGAESGKAVAASTAGGLD